AAPLWQVLAVPAPTARAVRLQATASGDLPPLDQFDIAGLNALTTDHPIHGNLHADLAGLAWEGIVRDFSAPGARGLEVEGGTVALVAPAEWLIKGQPEETMIEAFGLPPELGAMLAKPLSLSLGPPLQLQLLQEVAGTGIDGKLGLTLSSGDGAK